MCARVRAARVRCPNRQSGSACGGVAGNKCGAGVTKGANGSKGKSVGWGPARGSVEPTAVCPTAAARRNNHARARGVRVCATVNKCNNANQTNQTTVG